MTLSLTLLIVWLVTMPVAYSIALAVGPSYLRRRAPKQREDEPTAVTELAVFRARRKHPHAG